MEFKKYLDQILSLARENICEEVGGLLGAELALGKPELSLTSKEEFHSALLKNYGLATLDIHAPQTGTAYMACSVRDAIFMGGTLIMIPEAELKKNVQQGFFGEDEMDAYGEIANITAGILTTLFARFHPDKPRFTKSDIEILEPGTPATEDLGPVVLIRFSMTINGQELDPLEFLFPAEPLSLLKEEKQDNWPHTPKPQEETSSAPPSSAPDADVPDQDDSQAPEDRMEAEFLILYETPAGAAPFEQVLKTHAIALASHTFQDNFRKHVRTNGLKGVVIVMDQVSERGLAAVIKARSSVPDKTPILATGPQWTRRTVLQAAKYGVKDILVTPAPDEQVLEKILALKSA